MKLEDQVVSLELAKRLKELGVKQESYFFFKIGKASGTLNLVPIHETYGDFAHFEFYSAFTVSELGELLRFAFEQHGWKLFYKAYGDVLGFKDTSNVGILGIVNLMRNPNVAAMMFIYLIENKLVDLNQE